MKNPQLLTLGLCGLCASLPAETTFLDDFSGDLSAYTATVILDANGGGSNTSTWQTFNDGFDTVLELDTSVYDGIEQWAFIRNGLTLAVGEEIQADIAHSGASQDIGLYVGGTTPVTGTRANFISVYRRSDGGVLTRGFNGTGEFGLIVAPGPVTFDKLFIARTDTNTYDVGYYNGNLRVVFATRTPTTPNDGSVVGVYADVRNTGFLGTLDNLCVTDIPQLGFTLDNTTFQSGLASGASVGTLSAELLGTPATATFTFVAGEGDEDNGLFTITGDQLQVNADFTASGLAPFEGDQFFVRILATSGSDTLELPFTLTVTVDDDLDNLADDWEDFYFGDGNGTATTAELALQDGNGDPDGDGLTNEQEETAGSDPTVNPIDTDSDGLCDTWELFYFSDLDELSNGNTDGDSAEHLAEQNGGSNPTVMASVPGDTDGDGTPDGEEFFQPYTADANTLHLWHLDEIKGSSVDAGSDPITMTTLEINSALWAPSLAGFGTGFSSLRGSLNGTGGYLAALPLAGGVADNSTMALAGADGAFTFEALVQLDFDPAAAPESVNPMQIISGDGEDNAVDRAFQFRILPVGHAEHGGGTAPELEFLLLSINGVGIDVYRVKAPLPTTGDPDAAVQGNWYHVAVAYNGTEATANNTTLYWTLMDPARTSANVLVTGQIDEDPNPALTPDFVIGNEGRATGGASDAFRGTIDEVRISDIDRGAQGFYFTGEEIAVIVLEIDNTKQLSWNSTSGKTYTIQRATDLTDFTAIETNVSASGTGTTTFTDPDPPLGKAFYRVVEN